MDKLSRAALRTANKVRKALGAGPVDHLYAGVPQVGWACPITATIYDDSPELRENHIIFTNRNTVHVFDRKAYEAEHPEVTLEFADNGTPRAKYSAPSDVPFYEREREPFDVYAEDKAIKRFKMADTAKQFVNRIDALEDSSYLREQYPELAALILDEAPEMLRK